MMKRLGHVYINTIFTWAVKECGQLWEMADLQGWPNSRLSLHTYNFSMLVFAGEFNVRFGLSGICSVE
jgi:hypothetical protein